MITEFFKVLNQASNNAHLGLRLYSLVVVFLGCTHFLYATTSDVNVTVTSASTGETLVGVNIYTEDFTFATSTDIDGNAVVSGLGFREEVIFSYIGYSDVKLPIYEIRRLNGLIKMYPDVTADTIVVIGRRDDPIEEIPYQIERIKKSDIKFTNAQTSADALASNAGVFVQKTQMGGGSPVLRGFEANRVLLVLDGVRMNNAIYRNGHLQNAVTVDNSMLEQMEVIYGPGSLIYGSDALGGVVHFRSKDPKLRQNTHKEDHFLESNFYTRFASANLEKRVHLDVNYGKDKWGFLSSITLTDYDALRAGNNRPDAYPDFGKRPFYTVRQDDIDLIVANPDPNVQIAMGGDPSIYRIFTTEYSQFDFLQKVKIRPTEEINLTFNYQFSSTTDVPRYDNLLDTLNQASKLKFSEWYYGPQMRSMFSAKARILNANPMYDKATFIAAFQRVSEDRLKRKFANSIRTVNKEEVYIYSLTADFDKFLDEQEQSVIAYGLDISQNVVESKARELDIGTGKIILGEHARYPSGGSSMRNLGAYTNYRWRSQDSTLIFNGGLRYSSIGMEARYLNTDQVDWPEEYYSGINNSNSDLTWAAGLTWNNKDKWQARFLIAKAFRAPNIDDWAKLRVKGSKVTIPNVDLQPERALNYELTVAKEFGDFNTINNKGTSFKVSATGFYSRLRDAIVRVDSSSLPEPVLVVDDELHNIQTNINASTAKISGFSANILFNKDNKLQFKSSINLTKGTTVFSNAFVQDTIVPFAHIPPMYGTTGVSYKIGKLKVELNTHYNGRKKIEDYSISDIEEDGSIDREGTSDNIELTPTIINEEGRKEHVGSYGWSTLNFYSTYQFNPNFSLNFSIENIADRHYRPFASTISAPGRNLVIALYGKF